MRGRQHRDHVFVAQLAQHAGLVALLPGQFHHDGAINRFLAGEIDPAKGALAHRSNEIVIANANARLGPGPASRAERRPRAHGRTSRLVRGRRGAGGRGSAGGRLAGIHGRELHRGRNTLFLGGLVDFFLQRLLGQQSAERHVIVREPQAESLEIDFLARIDAEPIFGKGQIQHGRLVFLDRRVQFQGRQGVWLFPLGPAVDDVGR